MALYRTASVLLLILCFASPLRAQSYWVPANGELTDKISAIAHRGGSDWCAASRQRFFQSADDGATWRPLLYGLSLNDVYSMSVETDTPWFIGTDRGVCRSQDAGVSWTVSTDGLGSRPVYTFLRLPDGRILLGCSVGPYRSSDGGRSWTRVAAGMTGNFAVNSLARTSAGTVIAGTNTGIYRSTDAAGSWTKITAGVTSTRAYGVKVSGTGTIYVGSDSCIYTSTDDGLTYTRRQALSGPMRYLAVISDAEVYAACPSVGVAGTTDQGVNWNTLTTYTTIASFAHSNGGTLLQGIDPRGLYRRGAGQPSWVDVSRGFDGQSVGAVAFDPAGRMLAGVRSQGGFRSVDGGASWIRLFGIEEGSYVNAITFPASNTILAALDGGSMLWSTNDGETWGWVPDSPPRGAVTDLLSTGGGVVLAATANGVFRSTDAGLTWSANPLPGPAYPICLVSTGPGIVLTGSSNGLFRSTDGGVAWSNIGFTGQAIHALARGPDGTVYAGAVSGVYRSIDGGLSWVATGLTSGLFDVIVAPLPGVVFAANVMQVYRSSDGGITWADKGLMGVLSMAVSPTYILYAGTNTSGVVRTSASVGLDITTPHWMAVGSLHNWYDPFGSEREEGWVLQQQYGMEWPAWRPRQDIQAWKGLWIACTDYEESDGKVFPHKVVYVGPKVDGHAAFFPIALTTVSRFAAPEVTVDGMASREKPVGGTNVEPALAPDREIRNDVQTSIGIRMNRRILGFSQEFHDNYIVTEYTFTNTTGKTLTGAYFYFLYRLAPCAETRYVIGNSTGWGINTMLDTRGDGVKTDPPGEQFRAQYAWHGKFLPFTLYDNLGGPIWAPNYVAADTVGRLGAAQFAGIVTLHADRTSTDASDDVAQPATTSWEESDAQFMNYNDPFSESRMTLEYTQWIARGHKTPRHADDVEPSGNFAQPTNDPSKGTSGGFSATNGYGPYTIAPGEDVRIVLAEAVAGLSQSECVRIGQQYKNGQITALQKNQAVLTGKDSLFQTFARAKANFASGYAIPNPPRPPKSFRVTSNPDPGILLEWEVYEENDPAVTGFEIYRSEYEYYREPVLIQVAPPTSRGYVDSTVTRGVGAFYYIVSVGKASDNNGTGLTPQVALRSSRFYTQTYDPAFRLVSSVTDGDVPLTFALEQNYPNPFNPTTEIRYQVSGVSDVKLVVYDILGREVATLVEGLKDPGRHEVTFDASGLASGVYVYRLTAGSSVAVRKMMLMK